MWTDIEAVAQEERMAEIYAEMGDHNRREIVYAVLCDNESVETLSRAFGYPVEAINYTLVQMLSV